MQVVPEHVLLSNNVGSMLTRDAAWQRSPLLVHMGGGGAGGGGGGSGGGGSGGGGDEGGGPEGVAGPKDEHWPALVNFCMLVVGPC